MTDSTRIRALVVDAVEATAEMVARPSVADAWDAPSALDGMTVGALAAHVLRAAGSTIAYLDRSDPDSDTEGDLLTPVGYFHAALTAPIHDRIKEVSAEEASIGHGATVEKLEALAGELGRRLAAEPEARVIGALGGRSISLDDFCRTRLIEVLTHLDDLAASVGEERPPTDPESIGIVIGVLVGIAREVHGDWSVLHALSRWERLGDRAVFPVF